MQMGELFEEFERDALAKLLGIEIVEIRPGYAKTSLEVTPDLVNSLGMTHGSTVFALVDMAVAAASNAQGLVAVTLNISISFLQGTRAGDRLYAEAREEHLTRRTGVYQITVEDSRGTRIAVATGTAYRTGATFAESRNLELNGENQK